MPYYPFPIRLTPAQKRDFAHAIANNTRVRIIFTPKQIGAQPGDMILVTKRQMDHLLLGKSTKTSVYVNFNKTQLRLMRQQIGNGILDSIGGFFKGAATKVGNWFSGANKQPKPVELSTFNKAQTTKHKAEAFFDEQRQ